MNPRKIEKLRKLKPIKEFRKAEKENNLYLPTRQNALTKSRRKQSD